MLVKGQGGQIPARYLHRPKLPCAQGRSGLRLRRLRGQGRALWRTLALLPAQQGHQAVPAVQQRHQQIQIPGPRHQLQQSGQLRGGLTRQQQARQKGLQPRRGAVGKLGLELLQAGKRAPCQLLQGLIRGKALVHQREELPQSLRRPVQVYCPRGRTPGDHRPQVERGQIARGGAVLQGKPAQSGQHLGPAGGAVQPQGRQQGVPVGHFPRHGPQQPGGQLFRPLLGGEAVQGRVHQGVQAVPVLEQPRFDAVLGDPVDLPPQLLQLCLEVGAVRPAVSGGLAGQLLHAAQVVLHLRQGGLPGLEGPAALPGLTPRLGDPAHELAQRLGDGGGRPAGTGRGPGLFGAGLLLRLGRLLIFGHGHLPVPANAQLSHFAGLLPSAVPLPSMILIVPSGGKHKEKVGNAFSWGCVPVCVHVRRQGKGRHAFRVPPPLGLDCGAIPECPGYSPESKDGPSWETASPSKGSSSGTAGVRFCRYCISAHCSLVMRSCRGLEPSNGPTTPFSSI